MQGPRGYNGSVGPAGLDGAQGPAGAGDLTQCDHQTRTSSTSYGVTTNGGWETQPSVSRPNRPKGFLYTGFILISNMWVFLPTLWCDSASYGKKNVISNFMGRANKWVKMVFKCLS